MNKDNLQKKWYVVPCHDGEQCWCRMILSDPETDDLNNCIIPSGTINEDTATYIVQLHNSSLEPASVLRLDQN